MKKTTRTAALIIAVMFAVLSVGITAFAESAGVTSAVTVEAQDGTVTVGDAVYYKVPQLIGGQDYLITAQDLSGQTKALAYDGITDWSYKESKGGGSGSKASHSLSVSGLKLGVTDGALTLTESSGDDKPGEPPSDKPDSGSGGDKPSSKPSSKPDSSSDSDKPSSKPSSKPGDKPSSKPGDKPSDKPESDSGDDKPGDPQGGSKSRTSWDYDGTLLVCTTNDGVYYLAYSYSAEAFVVTEDPAQASDITVYTAGGALGKCIAYQPCAAGYVIEGSGYEAPEFSIGLTSDDIVADEIIWYVDNEEAARGSLVFTADCLKDKPVGIYYVYCTVKGHDSDGNYYSEKSAEAAFVVAKGIIDNSVLTFSDVHEEYENISAAIKDIMDMNDGKIPALIVDTGDWVNGAAVDAETFERVYYPQIAAQQGGINAVYVAGNHEDSKAATKLSIESDLGADSSFEDGIGVIFDSRSKAAKDNGTSSKNAGGLIVYGINFYGLESKSDTGRSYSYENACEKLDSFLSDLAKNYNNEVVMISSHTGLHVLGIQPESAESGVKEWSGSGEYNLDKSAEIVKILNKYADKYGMDILFLFGHDHSKGEKEFVLKPGSELTSTVSYSDKTYETQTISFTYAHAGYISSRIGAADSHYSLIKWTVGDIVIVGAQLGSDELNTIEISRITKDSGKIDTDDSDKATPDEAGKSSPDEAGESTPGESASGTSNAGSTGSVATGDSSQIALWIVLLISGFGIIMYGIKKRKA